MLVIVASMFIGIVTAREFGPQPPLDVHAAGLQRDVLERLEPDRQAAHQLAP